MCSKLTPQTGSCTELHRYISKHVDFKLTYTIALISLKAAKLHSFSQNCTKVLVGRNH
jgi:hypothetical protein